MGHPRPLFSLFSVFFKQTLIQFYNKLMALGFEPTTFSRESPPITTKPGLPPNLFENFKNKTQSVFCLHLSRVNFLEYNPPIAILTNDFYCMSNAYGSKPSNSTKASVCRYKYSLVAAHQSGDTLKDALFYLQMQSNGHEIIILC